ncbi:putative protein-like [Trypanosoma grayi]|uniref:putative protein-like n=1 Tax=Trypanosoma grayi TaxID=71804 RepID=UPI0004F49111|nr:putative protein-like [Trypanosoma grayi]KEG15083.1 putative protein-like [Trypanosoma grayi]
MRRVTAGGSAGDGKSQEQQNSRALPRLPSSSLSHGVVAQRTPAQYGVVRESDEVHEEIRDLSSRVKRVIENKFQKHATSEEQVLQGIRRFGPSAQSKKVLNRENDAAMMALKTGVYAVWRCEQPKLSGSNTDFCTRLGYQHRCFCNHSLEEHVPPKPSRSRVPAPRCKLCGCSGFNYMPNEPEEIGEGWLTRRRNWDPSQWSAKCRCGHGHKQHDPQTRSCKQCGCSMFTSHFLCVVCDRDGEAHSTVFELEEERAKKGLPVREAYFPLGTLEWSVRELVLEDPTGGGALTAPPQSVLPRLGAGTETVPQIPQHCDACAAVFRSAQSKFCSKCGKPRQ